MPKKRKSRKKHLQSYAEEFALSLIFEASGGKVGKVRAPSEGGVENPVSFRDRRALLDSDTKLLGAQPETDATDEDGIESFRERLKPDDSGSGTPERGADSPDEV